MIYDILRLKALLKRLAYFIVGFVMGFIAHIS